MPFTITNVPGAQVRMARQEVERVVLAKRPSGQGRQLGRLRTASANVPSGQEAHEVPAALSAYNPKLQHLVAKLLQLTAIIFLKKFGECWKIRKKKNEH